MAVCGEQQATSVVITDDISSAGAGNLTFVNPPAPTMNGSPAGVTVAGTVLTANYSAVNGPLQPGQSIDVRFRVQIAAGIPAGTILRVRINEYLSSDHSQIGDRVTATLDQPVVVNGYSQGGLVASLVASSGNFDVKGVVTFGAPSGQVHIPASVPVLSVRNAEDLVPATSGYDVNPHAVVVQRTVFAHQPVPSDWAVPAHRLDYYQQTAAIVDNAQSERVRSVLDPLDAFGAGATKVDSTLWVATRVPG